MSTAAHVTWQEHPAPVSLVLCYSASNFYLKSTNTINPGCDSNLAYSKDDQRTCRTQTFNKSLESISDTASAAGRDCRLHQGFSTGLSLGMLSFLSSLWKRNFQGFSSFLSFKRFSHQQQHTEHEVLRRWSKWAKLPQIRTWSIGVGR